MSNLQLRKALKVPATREEFLKAFDGNKQAAASLMQDVGDIRTTSPKTFEDIAPLVMGDATSDEFVAGMADLLYPDKKTGIRGKVDEKPAPVASGPLPENKSDKQTLPAVPKDKGKPAEAASKGKGRGGKGGAEKAKADAPPPAAAAPEAPPAAAAAAEEPVADIPATMDVSRPAPMFSVDAAPAAGEGFSIDTNPQTLSAVDPFQVGLQDIIAQRQMPVMPSAGMPGNVGMTAGMPPTPPGRIDTLFRGATTSPDPFSQVDWSQYQAMPDVNSRDYLASLMDGLTGGTGEYTPPPSINTNATMGMPPGYDMMPDSSDMLGMSNPKANPFSSIDPNADPFAGLGDTQDVFGQGYDPNYVAPDPFAGLGDKQAQRAVFGRGMDPGQVDPFSKVNWSQYQNAPLPDPNVKPPKWTPVTDTTEAFKKAMGWEGLNTRPLTKPMDWAVRNSPWIVPAALGYSYFNQPQSPPNAPTEEEASAAEQEYKNAIQNLNSLQGVTGPNNAVIVPQYQRR